MKTKNKYNERLIKFAKHLEKTTNHYEFGLYKQASLVEVEKKRNTSFLVTFHEWVFEELPIVFKEWYFAEKTGDPVCEGSLPEEGTVGAVIDFFNLRMDEFCHLFDLEGFQNVKKFGGSYLNFESEGPVLAKNIFDLVERRIDSSKC